MENAMSGITITPANSPFSKFCGSCGTRFEKGQLLPTFIYCMHCGNDLAPWMISAISMGIPPVTPPTTPAANRQIDQSHTDHETTGQEMENVNINESGCSIVSPSRGRGESRARGRRHGGGRGRGIQPLTLTPLGEHENLGRGMRNVTRLDYSEKHYWNALYGRSKKNDAKRESLQKGRQNLGAPSSPTQGRIRAETDVTCTEPGESLPSDEIDISQDFPEEGDPPVARYRPTHFAKRSRPFPKKIPKNVAAPRAKVEQNPHIQEPSFEYQDEPQTSDEEEKLALSMGNVIRLDAFDLGPPIDVPPECTEPIVQSAFVDTLRKLTAIESLHEFIPQEPGQHGILYIDRLDFPDNLDKHDFSLLRSNGCTGHALLQYYLGQYQIAHIFRMTLTQWGNVCESVKVEKTRHRMIEGEASKWCLANGVDMRGGFRDAVDQGRWRFDCLVIQCIGFDRKLYELLRAD